MANSLIINNRILRNGDYVLFIRHPTLQKMSVMCMKVKIQRYSFTIRMNTALCMAYNADFDGDEMNIFCLTNYNSISEASYLNSPLNSIISPQNDEPIIYPSQDCISGTYLLTCKNNKIKKTLFYNCLSIINKNIKDVSNIKLDSNNLFSLSLPENFNFTYNEVNIKNGILKNGCINKNIMLKIIKYMLYYYDKYIVSKFIYNIQIIVEEYLSSISFSIGYDDCFINYKNKEFSKINKYLKLIITNDNYLYNIINSGSKGSKTNISQILIKVGQQYIKDKKIENLIFLNNNSYCHNNYIRGLNYYEYFYSSQSAREGVVSTNIKTPHIGYTQRQLSKFLEELVVQYDKYMIFNKFILN